MSDINLELFCLLPLETGSSFLCIFFIVAGWIFTIGFYITQKERLIVEKDEQFKSSIN